MNNKPATPLPWEPDKYGSILAAGERLLLTGIAMTTGHERQEAKDNTAYMVHAANAYPRLVEALKCALKTIQVIPTEMGNDIGNPFPKKYSQPWAEQALSLLRELGEDA